MEEKPQEPAADQALEPWLRQTAHFLETLSAVPEEPVPREPNYFDSRDPDDFSLPRVALGYGIPPWLPSPWRRSAFACATCDASDDVTPQTISIVAATTGLVPAGQ